MNSIAAKLLLSFLAVVAVGVVAVAYLANRATDAEFATYVASGGTMRQVRAAEMLSGYYVAQGNWDKIGPVLTALARSPQERLVLVDAQGTVVGDSAGHWVGQQAAGLGLQEPSTISADGRPVGELYSLGNGAAGPGLGPGGPGGAGRGRRGQNDLTPVVQAASPEESFLAGVQQSLWLAALLAGVLALALAALLTRQIVRPLRLLARGADRLAAGNLEHRVAVNSHDELGKLAVSFNTMAANLERNEAQRRSLLADVAHELRTPLSIIEGTADAMLDGVYDLSADNVRVVKDQAQLLAKLITDLRELSLAEAGQFALAEEPTDMAELARRALQHHEATALAKGIRLTLDAPAALPLIPADPARLAQVLNNLIANALRYTPGGGTVSVAVRREATAARIVVRVADTGEGIAPDDLPHVFDRFFRADRSRARRSGGSGLGLAIARQIVAAHGGQIWAESAPGVGSTFSFALPIAGPAARGQTKAAPGADERKPAG